LSVLEERSMKVDISDITRFNGASSKIEFEETLPMSEPVGGYFLDGSVKFDGTISNLNGIMELDGRLKVGYSASCYRCLNGIKGQIDIRLKENFVNDSKYAEEIDAYVYEGKLLETEKAFFDNIILNLPMKQVCSRDCKGLCPKCGINLNKEECNCRDDSIDSRLTKFGDFFNN
jgi:uncharacterized protein